MSQGRYLGTTIQDLPDAVVSKIFAQIGDGNNPLELGTICKQWYRVTKMLPRLSLYEQDGFTFNPNGMQQLSRLVYSCKCIRSLHLISRRRRNTWTEEESLPHGWTGKGFPDLHLRGMIHHVRKTVQELGFAYPAYIFRIWIDLAECPFLQRLQLQNAWIEAFPEDASPLLKLEACCLISVLVTAPAVTELVNLCPVLKRLELKGCSFLKELLISSRSIEIIEVSRCDTKVLTLDTPNLKLLNVELIWRPSPPDEKLFKGYLHTLYSTNPKLRFSYKMAGD